MSQTIYSPTSQTNRARGYAAGPNRGASCIALGGPTPSTMFDKFLITPISACVFALIVSPLLTYFSPLSRQAVYNGDSRLDNRIFWPAMAAISILLVVQNRSRFGKLTWPPHIICLLAYLAFAGASVLWAFSPQSSFTRS